MNWPFDRARDDLDRAVKARRKLDLIRDEQRQVHHLTEHRNLRPGVNDSSMRAFLTMAHGVGIAHLLALDARSVRLPSTPARAARRAGRFRSSRTTDPDRALALWQREWLRAATEAPA